MPELIVDNRFPRDVMNIHTGEVRYVGNEDDLKKARSEGFEDRRSGVEFPKFVNVGAVTGQKDAEGRSLKLKAATAEEEVALLNEAKAFKADSDKQAIIAAKAADDADKAKAAAHEKELQDASDKAALNSKLELLAGQFAQFVTSDKKSK